MRKAFTLVELLVVVVVLTILIMITFRLSSSTLDHAGRNVTVAKLQKLENCLSGYYAAFGTYPPVSLHNSRNYKIKTTGGGVQVSDGEEADLHWDWYDAMEQRVKGGREATKNEAEDWEMVQAACKAQPFDCCFPYPDGMAERVKATSRAMMAFAATADDISEERRRIIMAGFDDGVTQNRGRHALDKTEWRDVKLFKFGLMSFLLPRYQVMMSASQELYQESKQWEANNSLPRNPLNGEEFDGWGDIWNRAKHANQNQDYKMSLSCIPSQAVCARWMANLEHSCDSTSDLILFGIDLRSVEAKNALQESNYKYLEIYNPKNDDTSTDGQYILNRVTVTDGWRQPFYYYSPAPYQSYVLWSAGANGRTFPPWVSRANLDGKANACISHWIKDDIVGLSH